MSDAATIHAPKRQKELGAFYTPPPMAKVLTDWAVREPSDRVLDPSFGGLVFLSTAHQRLVELGATDEAIRSQLFGVDLDVAAHAIAEARNAFGVQPDHLLNRDFFEVDPNDLPRLEAVVGNPPYIRYQGFNGSAARARELAEASGVKLTRLASSWAPFLIHATSFISPGGRMAQVLPAELLHSQYAAEVIEFLRREFGALSIVVFEERVFPGALEEVVLLFADDRGAAGLADVSLIPCQGVADVQSGLTAGSTRTIGPEPVLGRGKLLAQLLPRQTQALYERLARDDGVTELGKVASVDIGIVTGANEFFVLSESDAEGFHPELLKPGVCKAAQVAGARLSAQDHRDLVEAGHRAFMFVADAMTSEEVLKTSRAHLRRGERAKLNRRYKCRIRDPWWALPVPKNGPPDLLLTYCANEHPRLALNDAEALNTNTLHGVRPNDPRTSRTLAAGFYNSLTLLSAELVGRSYGGGVLKLEPSEAEALLLPSLASGLAEVLPAVDAAVRARDLNAAANLVDPIVLGPLGLAPSDLDRLRSGRRRLRERRSRRGRPPQ